MEPGFESILLNVIDLNNGRIGILSEQIEDKKEFLEDDKSNLKELSELDLTHNKEAESLLQIHVNYVEAIHHITQNEIDHFKTSIKNIELENTELRSLINRL